MNLIDWLLDSDPAIRWQTLRDLRHEDVEVVAAERDRVAREGWGAEVLAAQGDDGRWTPDTVPWVVPGDPTRSTMYALVLLRAFGVHADDPAVQTAVRRAATLEWDDDGVRSPLFDGESEACLNGMVLAVGAAFRVDVHVVLHKLLDTRLGDGGWNCDAPQSSRSSFHSTLSVLDGLQQYGDSTGFDAEVEEAVATGWEYLLERGLMRSKTTGAIVEDAFLQFGSPSWWQYDVLRALDVLRVSSADPRDQRIAEALDLVESKRQPDGTWLLERQPQRRLDFRMGEQVGQPSRWITLRALRVLDWADRI